MTDREKDSLAAQALAVIQARFDPPGPDDTVDILERARRLAKAPAPAHPPLPVPASVPAAVPAPERAPFVPSGPAPNMRLVDRCLLTAGALLLAVYFFRLTRASLQVYFTPDDLMNLYRSWIFSVGSLVKANLLFFLSSDFIRPMGSLWYRVIVDFAGFHPYWFHASNLVILAANIWLTYTVAGTIVTLMFDGAVPLPVALNHAPPSAVAVVSVQVNVPVPPLRIWIGCGTTLPPGFIVKLSAPGR